MARRNQHSREELQALAIDAVRELVAEHGLAKLSVRKVAEKIRYTPGMLYHVFANLDDLILHANAATLDTLLADMKASADLAPSRALHQMASAYLSLARTQTALWQMVFMHRMQHAAPVPPCTPAEISPQIRTPGKPAYAMTSRTVRVSPAVSGIRFGHGASRIVPGRSQ